MNEQVILVVVIVIVAFLMGIGTGHLITKETAYMKGYSDAIETMIDRVNNAIKASLNRNSMWN